MFLLGDWPRIFLTDVNILDEGLQLSSASFAERGLVPFRDYYVPYGPGNAYMLAALRIVGFDTIVAARTLFLILNAAVAGLGAYIVVRRRGYLPAVLFFVLILAFPPSMTYTAVVLLFLAAIVNAIGWRTGSVGLDLSGDLNTASSRRAMTTGLLLAVAVWFRPEWAAVLGVWLGLLIWSADNRSPAVTKPVITIPVLAALVPYAAIVLVGGAGHLIDALKYLVFDYSSFRGLAFPVDAPGAVVSELFRHGTMSYAPVLWTLSYFFVGAGLALLLLGPLADRVQSLSWARIFERDQTLLVVLVGATAFLLLMSLRIRPDPDHASQLIVLGWLALFWNRTRIRWIGLAIGLSVWGALLAVAQPFSPGAWTAAIDVMTAEAAHATPRLNNLTFSSDEAGFLDELAGEYHSYLVATPSASSSVFVVNRKNDLTVINSAIVYWLLDAKPAHWLTTFDPGFADQTRHQLDMVDRLCETRAMVVRRQSIELMDEHPPDRRFSTTLDDFLSDQYRIVFSSDRYDLMEPIPGGCFTSSGR